MTRLQLISQPQKVSIPITFRAPASSSLVYLAGGYSLGMRRNVTLIVLLVAGCSSALAAGCGRHYLTPVTFGPDHMALGLFAVTDEPLHPAVRHTRITGLGLLVIDDRISLGIIDCDRVIGRLEGESYLVETSLGTLAVGEAAEQAALTGSIVPTARTSQ